MAVLVKRYKGLNSYKDRHGRLRHYYRPTRGKRIPIKAEFGSYEFDQAYEAARALCEAPIEAGKGQIRRGTVSELCAMFYQSAEFKSLTANSQKYYRRQIEIFREDLGAYMVAELSRRHFQTIKDAMADRPGACRVMLKRLKTLFNFAISRDFITVNPMNGIKLPAEGDGFKPWSDDDIDRYLAHWPEKSRERLALYLLLFLGQRRSDTVKMGWHSVKDGMIRVVQQKTGTPLYIPLHPILRAELNHHPRDQAAFLVSRSGQRLSGEGFSNWIRQSAKDAGIEGTRGPHGLRKAACRRLIEAGCNAELARAISGHASEKELAPYIKDVNQKAQALTAISMLNQNKA